ncbi:MAG: hypothetical protein AAFO96_28095 [Bacteroidota bacterium]
MKIQTYFLIPCFLWSYTWVEAQENLVPNPGFEEIGLYLHIEKGLIGHSCVR